MDTSELQLFTRAVDQLTSRCTGTELDAGLDDLGWGDALADDRRAAVAVLFDRQGWANASSNALGRVVADGLGIATASDRAAGAAGDGPLEPPGEAAIVLPPLGRWQPPGAVVGGSLAVRGLGLSASARHPTALVVATTATAGTDVVVRVPTEALAPGPLQGADPALGLVELSGDVPV
ncbi:MAG TPA: hypothetical protein VMU14_16260, partial [Acidimicrobiales bacterium]|nr:hypothetical protein [Acidimicrobiales bacterium]